MDLFSDLKPELRLDIITANRPEGVETEPKNVKSESEPILEVTAKKVSKNLYVTPVSLP